MSSRKRKVPVEEVEVIYASSSEEDPDNDDTNNLTLPLADRLLLKKKKQSGKSTERKKLKKPHNTKTLQGKEKVDVISEDRKRERKRERERERERDGDETQTIDVEEDTVIPHRPICFSPDDLKLVSSCSNKFYNSSDDYDLCRRLRVDRDISLKDLRVLIHKTYSREYDLSHSASSIKVYSRGSKDLYADFTLTTDAKLKAALGYAFPYETLAGPDDEQLLITVARHIDDTYQHVLVLPVIWPVSSTQLKAACLPLKNHRNNNSADKGAKSTATDITERVCLSLADAPPEHQMFQHIPAPVHIDDWQAQYREHPQEVADLPKRRIVTKQRTTVYILPIDTTITPTDRAPSSPEQHPLQPLLKDLRNYIEAYYDSTCVVKILPLSTVNINLTTNRHKISKTNGTNTWASKWKGHRVHFRTKKKVAEQGQLCATDLLSSIVSDLVNNQYPSDAVCVLGVTLNDLFMDETDDFTQGLAGGTRAVGAGVFSFFRYHAGFDKCDTTALKLSPNKQRSLLLARAAKTAVHELGHMFSIGHCVHRLCCMNGSGNLREDFAIPEFLCPVDLAKFKHVLGPQFDAIRRYCKLLNYYRETSDCEEQAKWMRNTLKFLHTNPEYTSLVDQHLQELNLTL